MATPLQWCARERNWKLARLKMAIGTLHHLGATELDTRKIEEFLREQIDAKWKEDKKQFKKKVS